MATPTREEREILEMLNSTYNKAASCVKTLDEALRLARKHGIQLNSSFNRGYSTIAEAANVIFNSKKEYETNLRRK